MAPSRKKKSSKTVSKKPKQNLSKRLYKKSNSKSNSKSKKLLNKMEGKVVPKTYFKTRVKETGSKKENKYKWKTKCSKDIFKNNKSVVFSLPGAFTPTCSNSQLPDYEKYHDELLKHGVDNVYCLSVNDAFVMHHWKNNKNIKKVKMLPDGNGDFTRQMGALVKKNNLGFGDRSWRYSMLVDDGKIIKIFSEPDMKNNHKSDPFVKSDVKHMLKYLQNQ